MMYKTKLVTREFLPYFIIGGVVTLLDWSLFAMAIRLGVYYQTALVCSFLTAGTVHYVANKFITFRCQSKKIGSQFSLYLLVALLSLFLSMGVLAFLVRVIGMQKVLARMLTTILMLVPNYLLHKHITFSKKIFIS